MNFAIIHLSYQFHIPKGYSNAHDHYLSVIYTPDYILEEYPKITLNICDLDYLSDETFLFAARLLRYIKKKKNVQIKYFRYMFHGVLDMTPSGFNSGSIYFDKSVEVYQNFLDE